MKRAVSAELLSRVAPRRSLPGTGGPTDWPSMQAWLSTLSKPRGPHKDDWARFLAGGRGSAPHDQAVALLTSPTIEALADAELEALAIAERTVMHIAHGRDAAHPRRSLLELIARTRGLADAVNVYVRACALQGVAFHHHLARTPSEHLRSAVVLADAASYAAGVAAAAKARPKVSLQDRARLSYVFPDEPWAAEDLADPAFATHQLSNGFLLRAVSDLGVVKDFLATAQGMHWIADAAFDLAATFSEADVLPLLERGLEDRLRKPKYGAVLKTPPRQIAEAIAALGSPAAAAVLARFAKHPILAPQILAWFRVHPEHTAALTASAGASSKLASTAQRIVGKQKATPASGRVAKDAALPAVLRDRPWTQKPEPLSTIEGLVMKGMELERLDDVLLATFDDHAELSNLRSQGIATWIARDWPKYLPWEGGLEVMQAASVVVSPAIAPAMALVLTDRKNYRHHARAWLLRNAHVASLGLVPDAVGAQGASRRSAEAALVLLATSGERAAVEKAAASYGAAAKKATAALLARDPRRVEHSVPKRPSILVRADLPPLRLREGTILGADAIDGVLDMLSLSLPEAPYAGLAELRDALDPASLGAFALELLEQWVLGDAPGRSEWMGFAVVHLPSDAGHARLASLAREWSTKNQAKCERACLGLASIGSDASLLHLTRIASTTRFQHLASRAHELVAQAAEARGLSVDELGDRTVPEVEGLDAKARALVVDSITRRLERLMITGRALDRASFETFFARHAIVGPLARTLVWQTDDGKTRFRVAEDGSLADVSDAAVTLAAAARVTLVHPARPPALPTAWANVIADYELIPPFEQLGRRVHTLSKSDARATTLDRAAGRSVPAKKLMGLLESRGWRRDAAGAPSAFLRDLGDVRATLPITPGFEIELLAHAPPQALGAITFVSRRHPKRTALTLGAVDPVTLSEVVRDVDAASALSS